MEYVSAQNISVKWGISKRRVQYLCMNNRIPGATRIGNMWVIPSDANKPKDSRYRERTLDIDSLSTQNRKSRRKIKSIVDSTFADLSSKGLSPTDILNTLIITFSSSILQTYIDDSNLCMNICENFFDYTITSMISDKDRASIEKFIIDNGSCLDDALSWVYQLCTKKSSVFKYKDTQFFTEKYMIKTLIDSMLICPDSKFSDPACGGGNFLLYAFDRLIDSLDASTDIITRVNYTLMHLCGYEIDKSLAYVAAFNLKLKAISILSKHFIITEDVFNALNPLVYHPMSSTVSGALDIDWENQFVINCVTKEKTTFAEMLCGSDIIVTNPPFQTIKGMPVDQRNYLQRHYPDSKCDMCNAFIDRILHILPPNGKAAVVTQNSWMYLDSFTDLRKKILSEYTIDEIWELGSNAFYNLSGEKANVALAVFTNCKSDKSHEIKLHLLRNMSIEEIERTLAAGHSDTVRIIQHDVLKNTMSRFDMVSTEHLRKLQVTCDRYRDYAVPMQGTSTGDAKNLIDYYWRHIGDKDWIIVSKGGGYSRYEGLNSYCVKWGTDGEYIKNTKGSAIRNANYFQDTQLVFSDTGTAGLNVRILMPNQIFVASGPGIRITKGRTLSHLAFLNSRFAAFYVRLISPKLTIAAGYIGQIPVTETILNSAALETYARQCLAAKCRRLARRPNNIEFSYIKQKANKSISESAHEWYINDLNDEWMQLTAEQKIEDVVNLEMRLSPDDLKAIDDYIGKRVILRTNNESADALLLDSDLASLLGSDCFPKRTKGSKKALGVDGIIEYISQIKDISCETAYSVLKNNYLLFERKYIDLYMHAITLSALKYRNSDAQAMSVNNLIKLMGINTITDIEFAMNWMAHNFNQVHNAAFSDKPMYIYNDNTKTIMREDM